MSGVRRSVRSLAGVTAAVLLLAGCGGGDDDEKPSAGASKSATAAPAPSIAFPKDVVVTGDITDPALQPVWLVRSTGTEDSTSYKARSQGMFVDGKVAVYFAQDSIFGVSTVDGKEVWRNPVDLRGEVVETAAPSANKEHEWTFGYDRTLSEDDDLGASYGDQLVTLDTQTGELQTEREVDGFGSLGRIVRVGDGSYYTARKGLYKIVHGEPVLITPAEAFGNPKKTVLADAAPIQGSNVVTVSLRRKYVDTAVVVGVEVPSGAVLWKQEMKSFKRPGHPRESATPSRFDGRWVMVREYDPSPDGGNDEFVRTLTLDPRTGQPVASARTPESWTDPDKRRHLLRITENDTYTSGSYRTVLPVAGSDDLLFEDRDGISRLDGSTGQLVWTSDTEFTRLATGTDPEWTLGGVSADGKHVWATFTSGIAGDVVALSTKTGKVEGRWHLDEVNASGLLQKPLFAQSGDAVLLGRNQAEDGSLTDYEDNTETPAGPLNDVGWFRFPQK